VWTKWARLPHDDLISVGWLEERETMASMAARSHLEKKEQVCMRERERGEGVCAVVGRCVRKRERESKEETERERERKKEIE
jgi:hypothetical protein